MKILILNCGSSSIKFKLFSVEKKALKEVASGLLERIKDHQKGINSILSDLQKKKIIKNLSEITAIGHRVVHGGEKFLEPVKINSKVLKEIANFSKFALLHNPHNLAGIKSCQELMDSTPNFAIFDTSFHQTMAPEEYLYAIPVKYYKKNHIRRYGFHGTSHQYVIETAQKILKNKNVRIISCHLGNGSSITAFHKKVLATSMGFGPLAGIPMGTRSGDIDPTVIQFFSENLKLSNSKVFEILNKESGLRALSEISSDMRDIYQKSKKKNLKALFTIEFLAHQIAKYIASYLVALQGLDAIVFTAGIGEHAFYLRESVCKKLSFLGIKLDQTANESNQEIISSSKSKVKVLVIPTNEELQIAKEITKII